MTRNTKVTTQASQT